MLCPSGPQVGSLHGGNVRSSNQSPSPSLCDLEVRLGSPSDGCHVDGLAANGQSIALPSMESVTTNDCQDWREHVNATLITPWWTSGYLVSSSETNGPTKTTEASSNDCPSISRTSSKRPARESALVASCLESKIRRLEVAGADPNVTDMVMRANPRRYMRYAQMQAKFLGWCRDHSVESKQPSSLLNFLAYGHATLR